MKQIFLSLILATSAQAKVCDGASSENNCRIEISCKEADPLSIFTEVEVGITPGGLSLFKYMSQDNGQRSIMLISDVEKTTQGALVQYISHNGSSPVSLKYDSGTMLGLFEQDLNGHIFSTSLTCTTPN